MLDVEFVPYSLILVDDDIQLFESVQSSPFNKLPLLQHDDPVLTHSVHHCCHLGVQLSVHYGFPDALWGFVRHFSHIRHHQLNLACQQTQQIAPLRLILLTQVLSLYDRPIHHPVDSPIKFRGLYAKFIEIRPGKVILKARVFEDRGVRGDRCGTGHIHPDQLPVLRDCVEYECIEAMEEALLHQHILHHHPHPTMAL